MENSAMFENDSNIFNEATFYEYARRASGQDYKQGVVPTIPLSRRPLSSHRIQRKLPRKAVTVETVR